MDQAGRARGRGRASEQLIAPPVPAGILRPQTPASLTATGRAVTSTTLTAEEQRTVSASTRGAIRSRRNLHDLVVTRPEAVKQSKKGSTGHVVQLTANYFKLQTIPNWTIYQYHVDFAPIIDITGARKALFRQHKEKFKGSIFDGATLFTSTKLPNEITKLESKREGDGQTYELTLKLVQEVGMTNESSLMVLNNILRRAMEELNLQLVGRNFFDPAAKIKIPEYRMDLWPGYITSIRQHEQSILVCAEISTKVMRNETLADILRDCIQNTRNYKEQFNKIVIGTTVLTDYSNKTYRVDDVDWESTPSSTFDTRQGPVSYVEYYQTRYNIKIKDPKQPLVKSRSTDRRVRSGESPVISLVPELCRATGLTDDMRSNFRLMKAVAEYTRLGPSQRMNRLLNFNNRLQSTPGSMNILKEWNMRLGKELIQIEGRELEPEKIIFGPSVANGSYEADWSRSMRDQKFHTVVNLQNWCLITTKRGQREAADFVQVLQDSVRKMGMQISRPRTEIIENDRVDDLLRALEICINTDPQMIMVVVSNNNQARYAAIKKKCCVDRAIPTQVMLLKTITPKDGGPRSLMSVATKVAIQLNCKLGAVPWFIKLPLSGLMVVGFDVSHDAKDRSLSYGALVASMDQKVSCRYFSAVSPHRNGEELTSELSLNMTKALKEYRREHNGLPSKILFYRDGVGEGQTFYVLEHEVASVKETLTRHYQDVGAELRFAFIVVNKRLNTRIFKGDRNPLPGTVIDDVITLPERYDFYLIPQCVRQGTVSPTSYSVIEDSLMLPPDKMQMLTFKMCHLYYNWSGTVRVPAVCQYAHKLSFLVGQCLHQAPSTSLYNKLYFL